MMAHLAVEKSREYFEPCGMFQNKVYDGVKVFKGTENKWKRDCSCDLKAGSLCTENIWSIFSWILTFLMWQEVSWMDEE